MAQLMNCLVRKHRTQGPAYKANMKNQAQRRTPVTQASWGELQAERDQKDGEQLRKTPELTSGLRMHTHV